jgi:hypothetical protein
VNLKKETKNKIKNNLDKLDNYNNNLKIKKLED